MSLNPNPHLSLFDLLLLFILLPNHLQDIHDNMDCAEGFMKFVIKKVLEKYEKMAEKLRFFFLKFLNLNLIYVCKFCDWSRSFSSSLT